MMITDGHFPVVVSPIDASASARADGAARLQGHLFQAVSGGRFESISSGRFGSLGVAGFAWNTQTWGGWRVRDRSRLAPPARR